MDFPRSSSPAPLEKPQGSKKSGLLKEKLELEKFKTKDGKTRHTIKAIEDQLTFDKGFYVFIRALQLLKSKNEGCVVVGLAGASGSGKTAFSEKVKAFMPGIAVISMDMYNDASKLIDGNFDDPRLTDYELLLQNLADLKAAKAVELPVYDFKQSRRLGFVHQEVPASRIVIIEGIYALSDKVKPLLDLRVSITGGVHFDLVKRVLRDINRSGQGPEEIIQQITDTVYPMYKAFIEPDLKGAQLRIYNAFNPFTGFMNATYILKSKLTPSHDEVRAVLGASVTEAKEAEMYDIYLLPPNEDPETCQSWLRMRNRDGRYSLMFEEWVTEGPFIISPRISFEVSVRILGGLMALGYEIGTIMKRTSTLFGSEDITIKFDTIEQLGTFIQVQGKDRERVDEVGRKLQLEGSYIARSYIEQVQLEKLTGEFQTATEEMKQRFSVNGESLFDNDLTGTSPPARLSFMRASSLGAHRFGHGHAQLSTSAPIAIHRKMPNGVVPMGNSQFPTTRNSSITAAGGGGGGGGNSAASGLLGQQLRASPSHSPDRLPPSPRHPSFSASDVVGPVGAAGLCALPGNGHPGSASWSKMQEQLEVLSEHVHRYSGLSLQMDAMIHQYRHTNEQLARVGETTDKLAAAVVALSAAQAAAAQQASTAPSPGLDQRRTYLLMGAVAGGCLALGASLGCAWMRRGSS